MAGIRMIHLLTVGSAFQARVLAARLGSEGIVTQLRGALDGPYPFGEVLLYVDAEDMALARQLLLADEVEAAFDGDEGPAAAARTGWPGAVQAVLVAGAIVMVALASTVSRLL